MAYSGSGADELQELEPVVLPAPSFTVPGEAAPAASVADASVPAPAPEPSLELDSSGPELILPGERVPLEFAVINSGTAMLSDLEITAPQFDPRWSYNLDSLAPGQREQFSRCV